MTKILIILFISFQFVSYTCISQKRIRLSELNLHLDKNKLFIIGRGTNRKSGIIAHRFNTIDSNITHIAIGFYQRDSLQLFHVSDSYLNGSAFSTCTLDAFVASDDVYYFSIWQTEISFLEQTILSAILETYSQKKIAFDASFRLNNSDTLYCSEFCATVLKAINPKKFDYKPLSIMLNNKVYEAFLERKVLDYYPVDFFECNQNFRKMFERHF